MNKGIFWFEQLEQMIHQKHMLSSSFYQAWTSGSLTKIVLQLYAKEYYQHVKAFPTYISVLHSRCDDLKIRRSLLTNLIDEEAGAPNHLDLWRSFALAIGVNQRELDTYKPQPYTRKLIDQFYESCHLQPFVVGLASLYCYESQIPAICQTKIDGLKKWYGLTDPESYRYFSVHQAVDVEHSDSTKQLLLELVSLEERAMVLKGAEHILNALQNFLDAFVGKAEKIA